MRRKWCNHQDRFLGCGEHMVPEVQSYQEQSWGSWRG